jgi:hypothetical protein
MALYPLKRLRHAGRVVVPGIVEPRVAAHVGFEPVANVEAAMSIIRDEHGPNPSIAVVAYPAAVNRA